MLLKNPLSASELVKVKMAAKQTWLALQPAAEPASPVCYADELEPLPDLETWMNLAVMQVISGKSQNALARLQHEQPDQYAELHAAAEQVPHSHASGS
jgi:type I restriction enzyme S subunit